jgi:hypothetical protein
MYHESRDHLAHLLRFGNRSVPHHVELTNFWNDPHIENSIQLSRFRYSPNSSDGKLCRSRARLNPSAAVSQ